MTTGKVAIITAAGSGMGAGAAKKLAEDGFNVAILSSSGKGEMRNDRFTQCPGSTGHHYNFS